MKDRKIHLYDILEHLSEDYDLDLLPFNITNITRSDGQPVVDKTIDKTGMHTISVSITDQ